MTGSPEAQGISLHEKKSLEARHIFHERPAPGKSANQSNGGASDPIRLAGTDCADQRC